MGKIRVFPSTQEQVAAVDAKVDQVLTAIGQIGQPRLQTKTVTPTLSQQIIAPDSGYDALSSAVVYPVTSAIDSNIRPENIANNVTILGVTGTNAVDLEKFIMRDANREYFTLALNGNIPSYACYSQIKLTGVIDQTATSIGSGAFENCSSLQEIDLRNATSIGDNAFQNCSALQEIDLRNATSIGGGAFYKCSALQEIDLRNATSITGGNNFYSCNNLRLIDLTSRTTPTTLRSSSAFTSASRTWIAVVADDTIKAAFQSATNWSAYASHFRTIAEVEAEVGMTYDEYYLQIFGHARNEVSA